MIPIALNYLGLDPHSTAPAEIEKAAALIKTIRPYVQNFHSSQYVTSLANGNTCLAVGWSGDIIQARDRAAEAGNTVKVAYSIPKEGAPQWFDMLAIPKDAKHPENAYAFINYSLTPKGGGRQQQFHPLRQSGQRRHAAGGCGHPQRPHHLPAAGGDRPDVHLRDQSTRGGPPVHAAVDRDQDGSLTRALSHALCGPCEGRTNKVPMSHSGG